MEAILITNQQWEQRVLPPLASGRQWKDRTLHAVRGQRENEEDSGQAAPPLLAAPCALLCDVPAPAPGQRLSRPRLAFSLAAGRSRRETWPGPAGTLEPLGAHAGETISSLHRSWLKGRCHNSRFRSLETLPHRQAHRRLCGTGAVSSKNIS